MLVAERARGVEAAERPGAPGALDVLVGAAAVAAGETWAGQPGAALAAALRQVTTAERMVGAAKVAVLGAFDASGEFRVDRHPSTATWLAAKTKSDRRRVRRQVGVARQLRSMALTEDAYRAGLVGFEHVAVLSRANTPDVAESFVEAEGELVAAARTLDFDLFCRAVRAWGDFVDPAGAEERARKQDERREGHASRTFDGMVRLDAWLEAIGGTEFLADGRGAPAGPQPGGPPSPSNGPLPDWWSAPDPFADTSYHDTMCELEDCTPVAPSQALSLGLAGTICRMVFGPDGHVLDFGEDKDYFTGPLREAIIIRDRFCRDEGCGVPGRECHIDHIIPKSRGGPTSERNGQCKCATANRTKGNRIKGNRMP